MSSLFSALVIQESLNDTDRLLYLYWCMNSILKKSASIGTDSFAEYLNRSVVTSVMNYANYHFLLEN
jgi:hypothetical protein